MSGTPFTTGQLGKLQSIVSIGVTTALPKVAERFGDPKVVLKALEGRGEIFAGHLEGALEQAINRILILIPRDPVSLTVDKHHEPDAFYRSRSGEIYVWDEFRKRIVSKAKSTKEGTSFKVNVSELVQDATDEQIEGALAKNHLFDESAVCAIIAEMIGKQPNGEAGDLINNSYANLFYTASCVVSVFWSGGDRRWGVYAWGRGGDRWVAGCRVLSPAN